MPIVANHLRPAQLERLGLSTGLQALSSGECIDEVFRFQCVGPPLHAYSSAGVPDGPVMTPVWDRDDLVVGVRETPEGLEFVVYGIEAPQNFSVLARTEQGFWVVQFDSLYEADEAIEDLQRASEAVGFRFLDRYLARRKAAEAELGTFEAHERWLTMLVAEIDRE